MIINKTEKMSNTDIKKLIHEEYKIDVDAIRNLSKLANDLTVNKKLIVPGGLEIQGDVTMKKDLKITGTIAGGLKIQGPVKISNQLTIGSNAVILKTDGQIESNGNISSKGDIYGKDIILGYPEYKPPNIGTIPTGNSQGTILSQGHLGMLKITTPDRSSLNWGTAAQKKKHQGGTIQIGTYNYWGRVWNDTFAGKPLRRTIINGKVQSTSAPHPF